ncbi:MAG: hypothetical protein U0V70_17485 [Terriglobia bacterium]
MNRLLLSGVLACLTLSSALAQDAVKVDPKHYKVELENAQVRVLRVHYGPHEKSVMHSHPETVMTFITEAKAKFTLPDGKSSERSFKAGETVYSAADTHLPENVTDKAFEGVLVELKGKPKAGTPAKK